MKFPKLLLNVIFASVIALALGIVLSRAGDLNAVPNTYIKSETPHHSISEHVTDEAMDTAAAGGMRYHAAPAIGG